MSKSSWKPLAGVAAIGMLLAAPAHAQVDGATINLELHNNSSTRKAFVTTATVNVEGSNLSLYGMEPNSHTTMRLLFPEAAPSGEVEIAVRVYGIDMSVDRECIYTVSLARPLEASRDRTGRGATTLCSGMFVVYHARRVDVVLSFSP